MQTPTTKNWDASDGQLPYPLDALKTRVESLEMKSEAGRAEAGRHRPHRGRNPRPQAPFDVEGAKFDEVPSRPNKAQLDRRPILHSGCAMHNWRRLLRSSSDSALCEAGIETKTTPPSDFARIFPSPWWQIGRNTCWSNPAKFAQT